MTVTQSLLDEALRLGDLELQMLADGELEQAEETAVQRGQLIAEALEVSQYAAKERSSSQELAELRQKLEQLMALQGRLTSEARELHREVRSELMRTRQESSRFAGYGRASRIPGQRSLLHKRS